MYARQREDCHCRFPRCFNLCRLLFNLVMSQPTLRSLVIDGSAVHYPSLPPASKKVIQIVSETTTTTSNNNIKQQQQPTTSNNNIKQQQQPTTTTNNNYTAASEKQSRSQSLTSLVVMALPSPSSCGTSPALVRFRIEMAKKSGSGRGGSRSGPRLPKGH